MLIDWLVIAAYLIGITVLGASAAKKVHTASDFFISREYGVNRCFQIRYRATFGSREHTRKRSLHVATAAPVQSTIGHPRVEGIPVPAISGYHIRMS